MSDRRQDHSQRDFDVAYWEQVWDGIQLPQRKTVRQVDEFHRLFARHLPSHPFDLLEVGCAPGSWLAYFHEQFDARVAGVEYAPRAHAKTVENMALQEIDADIVLGDFFAFEHDPYDVVFSSGFIEHYEDPQPVVQRLVDLAQPDGGHIVTVIPAMQGINWWISRTFRPRVAAGHYPILRQELRRLHEQAGVQTLVCRAVGCGVIMPPASKNAWSRHHPSLSRLVNAPCKLWSSAVRAAKRASGCYPAIDGWSQSIVYIGRR